MFHRNWGFPPFNSNWFSVPDIIFWSSHTFLDTFLPSFFPFVLSPQSPSLMFQLSVWRSVTYMDRLRSPQVFPPFLDFWDVCLNWPLLSFSHPLGKTSIWPSTIFCWQFVRLMTRVLSSVRSCGYSLNWLFVTSAVGSIVPRPLISNPSCDRWSHLTPGSLDVVLLWVSVSSKSGFVNLTVHVNHPRVA